MPKSKESRTTSFPTSTDKKKRLKDKKKKKNKTKTIFCFRFYKIIVFEVISFFFFCAKKYSWANTINASEEDRQNKKR